MALPEEIDQKRREIRTDGYAMSIGEWISLYEKNELDIHPEFQRFFRWSETQKTNLIESILLGIPIPPVFVSQRSDGVWDVVDGTQRLSTIFQLIGILKDEKNKLVPPLTLLKTKYLPSLEDLQWTNQKNPKKTIPADIQLSIKRAKISASIILKESDVNAKYDLFQRLNTGGSQLSPQEVRNCLLVMLNKRMYDWLQGLAKYQSFVDVSALSDRFVEEAYDIELVLRFMVLYSLPNTDLASIGDVGEFLTDRMTILARDKRFPYKTHEEAFKKTFDALSASIDESAFKRFSTSKKRHEGGFLLSQYEVVALGVGYNVLNSSLCDVASIPMKIQSIWSNTGYTKWAGSGVRASSRIPKLVPFGRTLFQDSK